MEAYRQRQFASWGGLSRLGLRLGLFARAKFSVKVRVKPRVEDIVIGSWFLVLGSWEYDGAGCRMLGGEIQGRLHGFLEV